MVFRLIKPPSFPAFIPTCITSIFMLSNHVHFSILIVGLNLHSHEQILHIVPSNSSLIDFLVFRNPIFAGQALSRFVQFLTVQGYQTLLK